MKQLEHDDIMEWLEDKYIEVQADKGFKEMKKIVLKEEIEFALKLVRNLKILGV